MAFDITVKNPAYLSYRTFWELMRDAYDGEDAIKARGETYLPMKSGTAAMPNRIYRSKAYEAYKARAEFPEFVAPTIRGTVGVMLEKPATITLPSALEPLRQRSTRDDLPLDVLHRKIATELMATGRFGLLPGITSAGRPYIAGYCAETIINWDSTDGRPDYVVLDETSVVRNRLTGAWEETPEYLECSIGLNGAYTARVWAKNGADLAPGNPVEARRPPRLGQRETIGDLPFVFVNTNGLGADPDDIPLYGLAKLAVRVYRLDADYTFAMHMTAEPTPVAIGFEDPAQAIKDGMVPTSIGSSKMWILPKGGDAKFLEFSGAGIGAQEKAIAAALDRAVALGAQILTNGSKAAESGHALSIRLGNQSSVLKLIAMNSAAGLEKALKNLAVWVGANPDEVKVEPNLDFFDSALSAQEITSLVGGWQAGAYSWNTLFERLQKGNVIPTERTKEDEQIFIASEQEGRNPSSEELLDPVSGKLIDLAGLPRQLAVS